MSRWSARAIAHSNPYWARYPGHLSSDPWFDTHPVWFTTLADVGYHPGQTLDWSELEDFEVRAPLRPVINGRNDATPAPLKKWHGYRYITIEEAQERDLICIDDLSKVCGVHRWRAQEWSMSHTFPRVMGYHPGEKWRDVWYDRIDCYDWVEENHPDLMMKES